ncbi:MAG: prepilin-type N-terminal cleavage/methylation domain-containing protein [Planctomycetota bacterium]|nr:prepilin-type N-terminal cleavage/methylation domain-containing protein [Planctomycetota bacterium]
MRRAASTARKGIRRADALPFAAGTNTHARRRGFSLIEVMIATAILMGSAVVLARLAGMGREQSQKARLYSDAQELCEQTMNELLLGLRPMELMEAMPLIPLPRPVEAASDEMSPQDPFADSGEIGQPLSLVDETDPEWRHSIRTERILNKPGMWALTVELTQGDQTLERPIRFSLTRWIAGPPPEGAFEELSRGLDEPATMPQGGLL